MSERRPPVSGPGDDRPNTLLLVDDEPHVCAALTRALRRERYTIHVAHDADQALAVLAEHDVDVVLSDQRMPGKLGTELLNEVMHRHPATIRMILSGAAEVSDITKAMESGAIYKFLTKPIDPGLLRANVNEAFSRARSVSAQAVDLRTSRDEGRIMPLAQLERLFPGIVKEASANGRTSCLAVVQADQFQNIVGSFGPAFGETYLDAIGAELTSEFGAHHWVCVLAPGSYAVLGADDDPQTHVLSIRTRVQSRFNAAIRVGDHAIRVSTSIGATIAQSPDTTLDELLHQASAAALMASQRGGGQMEIYVEALVKNFRTQLALESELRGAVSEGAFQMFYQPQVEIASGRIVGLEALLRWPHKEHGFVSPAEFIPLGERIGFIDQIGAWVLDNALKQYAQWLQAGCAPRELSINVSPLQLRGDDFVELVASRLAAVCLDPKRLVLEITESADIDGNERIERSLAGLRELGVGIAIDDFGTGYANITTLTRHAFKKLKIDRSLLPHAGDRRAATLFHNIVSLGQDLGMDIVAEGVETPQELAAVFESGCRVVQGYFYSPPVCAERLDRLLDGRFTERLQPGVERDSPRLAEPA